MAAFTGRWECGGVLVVLMSVLGWFGLAPTSWWTVGIREPGEATQWSGMRQLTEGNAESWRIDLQEENWGAVVTLWQWTGAGWQPR